MCIRDRGSLHEDYAPLHLAVPDQLIDRTRARPGTFFGGGLVAHIAFADPFCPVLRRVLVAAAREAGATVHDGGTYVVIEGPAFSTRAESQLYRSWGAHVIGMTALPEARLAREAEMCYATLAVVTDYDVWHAEEQAVSVELVVANLLKNVQVAKEVIKRAVALVPAERDCPCATALQNAIITSPEYIPEKLKADLRLLIGKYIR